MATLWHVVVVFNFRVKVLLWKTSGLFFFALFILDKLIEVSELVMPVASSGCPRVNDNINLHSFSLFPSPPYHTQSRSVLPVWLCLKTHIISLISSCQDNYSLLSEALEASSDCRATLSLTSILRRSTLASHGTDGKYFNLDSLGFTFKPSPPSNPLIINFFNDCKCNKKWHSFIDT